MKFRFGEYISKINITQKLPVINEHDALFICDNNTLPYAEKLLKASPCQNPLLVLPSGEEFKTWDSVLKILTAAKDLNLTRSSVFIGVGGGVIGDLTAFAASIYKRGCRLQLVATSLLAMADASVGGKTGFDLFGIKNLAGSFYPAETVYMPQDTLKTLPEREYKSGLAELIKTMILMGNGFKKISSKNISLTPSFDKKQQYLLPIIKEAVKFKGNIVQNDFKETKKKRALLNLGHTFGHALETAAGLGNITHGEAVAWGIVQSCYLGVSLGITPAARAKNIVNTIKSFGYDCSSPHSLAQNDIFINTLLQDKKNKNKKLTFIVPGRKSAQITKLNEEQYKKLNAILKDGYSL